MDPSELISRLEEAAPGAVLEMRPFGRGELVSLWISLAKLGEVSRFLREDPTGNFDVVENLSAAQLDGDLIFTYFLRSSVTGGELILRGSLSANEAAAELDSVAGVWPSARLWEAEISELYGVLFSGATALAGTGLGLLAKDWDGFPLRKDYVFPTEVAGIPHLRRIANGDPDDAPIGEVSP